MKINDFADAVKTNPIQSQSNPIKPKTNPILSAIALAKADSKGIPMLLCGALLRTGLRFAIYY